MADVSTTPALAIRAEATVQPDCRVVVTVPFAPGQRVVVFIVQDERESESFDDLSAAAGSSLDFWDSPLDDMDWNAVEASAGSR